MAAKIGVSLAPYNSSGTNHVSQEDVQLEIDPDPELEQEAEETAQRVMQGGELGIQRMSETDVHVQRLSIFGEDEEEEAGAGDPDAEIDQNIEDAVERVVVEKWADINPLNTDEYPNTSLPVTSSNQAETVQTDIQETATAEGVNSDSEDGGLASAALEKTTEVGQAWTKGAIGSLAGAGGKAVGEVGGGGLGAILGGAAGSALGPVGTVAGAAAGREIGQTVGGAMLGGAVSDATKELTDSTMPIDTVEELEQKYNQLEQELQELKKNNKLDTSGTTEEVKSKI